MLKSAYEGLNARPKVYLSKEYFCEMYPTCVSSKLCEFISHHIGCNILCHIATDQFDLKILSKHSHFNANKGKSGMRSTLREKLSGLIKSLAKLLSARHQKHHKNWNFSVQIIFITYWIHRCSESRTLVIKGSWGKIKLFSWFHGHSLS